MRPVGILSRIRYRALPYKWKNYLSNVVFDAARQKGKQENDFPMPCGFKIPRLKKLSYLDPSTQKRTFIEPRLLPTGALLETPFLRKTSVRRRSIIDLKQIANLALAAGHSHFMELDELKLCGESYKPNTIKRLETENAILNETNRKLKTSNAKLAAQIQSNTGKVIIPIDENPLNKLQFLGNQTIVQHSDRLIAICDLPKEYRDCKNQIIGWFQELILRIYRYTDAYKGKPDSEIIKALGIDPEGMDKRVLQSRYTAISIKNIQDGDIDGIMAADLEESVFAKIGAIFYIAEAMVEKQKRGRKMQRGQKMQLRMSRELLQMAFRRIREKKNWFKHIWDLTFHGLPVIARFQSKLAAIAMRRLKNFWMPGTKPKTEIKNIITLYAKKQGADLDENYIMRNVYEGPIAIKKDEEAVKFTSKVGIISKFFRFIGLKTKQYKRYESWDNLFDNELNEGDAVYGIGYMTLGRLIKLGLEVKLMHIWKKAARLTGNIRFLI